MSLPQTIKKLKSIADDAKALAETLKLLAEQRKDAGDTNKSKMGKLADNLDENARKAARERRQAKIKQLDDVIAKLANVLAIPGLPKDIRDEAKADRGRLVAKRGFLHGQQGTDFGGILKKKDVEELESLIADVKKQTAKKKKAAEFLQSALKIADLALRIAGKLAM